MWCSCRAGYRGGHSCGRSSSAFSRSFNRWERIGRKNRGDWSGSDAGQKVCRAAWGTIWVESTPGHGSTFTFTLPVVGAVGLAALPAVQEDAAQDQGERSSPASMSPLVLVVENDPKGADLLRIYLSEAGYTVDVARDGAEGLEKIRRLAPAAVVLDILLPKLDGWAFLTR